MNISQKLVSELISYTYNNKEHPEEQIALLSQMIRDYGFNSPIIIDSSNTIIAGHGRLEAAKRLWLERVPCVIKDDLSDEQIRVYRLLDNRIAELATNNLENITIELEALQLDWMNELYSWIVEVQTVDALDREAIEDDVPLPQETYTVEIGDIFQLGDHILMCWDSTNSEHIQKLMSGEKADMIFTDPPYNVNYKGQGENTSNTILNDKMSDESFDLFLKEVFARYNEISQDKAWVYVFHSTSTQAQFEKWLEANNFTIKNQLIWDKPMASLGWWDYRWKHEPFFYATKKGYSANFYWDRTHSTVWDFDTDKSDKVLLERIKHAREARKEGKTTVRSMKRDNVNEYVHPTQKPVELIGYALNNSSRKGEIVADLFGWSGSTLIACEKHQRRCRSMELDPRYIEVMIKRYFQYTWWQQKIECLSRPLDITDILD